jgi:hypothetical protein
MLHSDLDKDLILEFAKLVDSPALKAIDDRLKEMVEAVPKEPMYYAENPNHAHLYAGYQLAAQEIQNYIFNYMQYAIEDNAESGQNSST